FPSMDIAKYPSSSSMDIAKYPSSSSMNIDKYPSSSLFNPFLYYTLLSRNKIQINLKSQHQEKSFVYPFIIRQFYSQQDKYKLAFQHGSDVKVSNVTLQVKNFFEGMEKHIKPL